MTSDHLAGWSLRPMTKKDIDAVIAIERQSHPTAWPPSLFLGELELSWARVMTLRDPRGVLRGYVDYWLVYDEVHILNIAVAPSARRKGCGRFMLERVVEAGREHGAEVITLEVRENNRGAIRMYLDRGFVEVGRRKRYYADTGEDALIMALELTPARPEADV